MKRFLLFATVVAMLFGCVKNDVPTETPNVGSMERLPHFYGYAMPELDAPQTRGVADLTKRWHSPLLDDLTVKFLNGETADMDFVKETVKEWEACTGLQFKFLDDNTQDALIRIQFDDRSLTSWALTGTDHARVVDQTQATVQFSNWFRLDERFMRNEVLRAFGQVIGLDLEFRHPKFHPVWISDENGNIKEDEIRAYWESQLNSFITWEELKEYVIDPLEYHVSKEAIDCSDEYDPNSVMNWPFYDMIAENIPVLEYRDYPISELSEEDKRFASELYSELPKDTVIVKTVEKLLPLVAFDFTGSTLDMNLAGNTDFAVVWNWDDEVDEPYLLENQECGEYRYPENTTGEYEYSIEWDMTGSGPHRVVVCEIIEQEPNEALPNASDALTGFDLLSGNYASDFDFYVCDNQALRTIRVVGGTAFKPQTFQFEGKDALKALYLNQIGDSKIVVRNCPNLVTLATSTFIYGNSGWGKFALVPESYEEENSVARIIPESDPVTRWPELPEYQYSLSNNSTSGLVISNCPNITQLSLENTRLTSLNLSSLTKLNYLYLSSPLNGIVGGVTTNIEGRNLYNVLSTLPTCTGSKDGTVIVRGIDSYGSDYTDIYIRINILTSINKLMENKNWTIKWESGAVPMQ